MEKKQKEQNFLRVAKIIIPSINFLYNPKIIQDSSQEIERIDGKGLIYVSNHLNSLDQFPIISAIGQDKPLTILAKSNLLKLKRGKLYQYVGCKFIDINDLKSISKTIEELTKIVLHGGDILIFPEGTRNTTDKYMLKFMTGAITIAQNTGTKIIPYAINEDYKFFKNHLYVRKGEEFLVDIDKDIKSANEELEEIVRSLIWYNMELERGTKSTMQGEREKAIKYYQKKKSKLEKQRKKIN